MYIPLNLKSHYTLLSSIITPKILKGKLDRFALCDTHSVSGAVKFKKEFPQCILGIEINVLDRGKICILSKNYQGWKQLIKIASLANSKECLGKDIPYDRLVQYYTDDLIFIYKYLEEPMVSNSWVGIDYKENNFFLRDIHPEECVALHSNLLVGEAQLNDLEVVTCIKNNISVNQCREQYKNLFSGEQKHHICTEEEMLVLGYTQAELDNTLKVFDSCEEYKITRDPSPPKFDCGNQTSADYLWDLCKIGFEKKVLHTNKDAEVYAARLDLELKTILDMGFSDYFLILLDIIQYVHDNYYLTSVRGSATGCLVSYLIGLSKIDPLKFNLLFERFMHVGRGKSLPDIDVDVPADNREDVLNYIRNKYGHDRVGQISTYQTIKASAALKGVFRANPVISFDEVNFITKKLPEATKIADKLKDLPEDERSVILYGLTHQPDDFSQWCHLKDGEIAGEHHKLFEQAIRLEGLKSAKSKHAAGIVIAPDSLQDICPTRYDSETDLIICDMEMDDLEALGCVKLDILGLRLFSKIIDICHDLKLEYVIPHTY